MFRLTHHWRGTTADVSYPTDGEARADGKPPLALTTGLGERATPGRWNPEDTLGASLAQCQTLTFLALAQKVRLDVRAIDTEVLVALGTVERITSVHRVTLSATVRIAAGGDAQKASEMYHKAHKYCFIANSLKAEVVLIPTIEVEPG
jgi:organic hydroperoxide reductase OsmC/OhrA